MPSKNNWTFHNKPCNIKIHQVQKLKMLFYLHLKSCTESSMYQRRSCFIKWHIFANWALLQPFPLQSFARENLFGGHGAGSIDVGDGYWRRNVLETILRSWWQFWLFSSTTSSIFQHPLSFGHQNSKNATNIETLSPIPQTCHQQHLCGQSFIGLFLSTWNFYQKQMLSWILMLLKSHFNQGSNVLPFQTRLKSMNP